MAAVKKVEWIWTDGKLVKWDDATEHVLAHTLHYGLGAFEASDRTPGRRRPAAARASSAWAITSIASSRAATSRRSTFRSRAPIAQRLPRRLAREQAPRRVHPALVYSVRRARPRDDRVAVKVVVAAYEWIGAYTATSRSGRDPRDGLQLPRGAVDAMMAKGKLCGQYVGSVLAKREASRLGLTRPSSSTPRATSPRRPGRTSSS